MEVALTPGSIAWGSVGLIAGGNNPSVHGVDISDMENRPSPPGPVPCVGLGRQVQIAWPSAETHETGVLTAINELEAECSIEAHGAPHVVCGQRDGRDTFDHRMALLGASLPMWKVTARARHPERRRSPGRCLLRHARERRRSYCRS